MASHPPFIPDNGLVANEPSHCTGMIVIRASNRVVATLSCTCSFNLANRADDVIWCKDCGFVWCMNNLDPSHYLSSSVVILNPTFHVMDLVGLSVDRPANTIYV